MCRTWCFASFCMYWIVFLFTLTPARFELVGPSYACSFRSFVFFLTRSNDCIHTRHLYEPLISFNLYLTYFDIFVLFFYILLFCFCVFLLVCCLAHRHRLRENCMKCSLMCMLLLLLYIFPFGFLSEPFSFRAYAVLIRRKIQSIRLDVWNLDTSHLTIAHLFSIYLCIYRYIANAHNNWTFVHIYFSLSLSVCLFYFVFISSTSAVFFFWMEHENSITYWNNCGLNTHSLKCQINCFVNGLWIVCG